MGKKGGWFSAVRKVWSNESKENKDKKPQKSKKRWSWKQKSLDADCPHVETELAIPDPPPFSEEVKAKKTENEQSRNAFSVAYATAIAAEAAVATAAQAAVEFVRLRSATRYLGKSEEEIAAIKIQTAFRGYLARRALRVLRGMARLKSLIQGQSVKRQAITTLGCMQSLAHVQSQIRTRRLRMSEENQALQRQLLQKHEKELEKLKASMGEDWDHSPKSKEQVEAKLQHKQEAAARRERALAYSYSHKQMSRNSSRSANPTFADPNNPHWGWSWLERWMAARPWETRSTIDRELNSDLTSAKSQTIRRTVSLGEISIPSHCYQKSDNNKFSPTAQKMLRAPSRLSPSGPSSPKMRPQSLKGSSCGTEDDVKSLVSSRLERWRRHSIAGPIMVDDESLPSLAVAVPSYKAVTQSAKGRSGMPSPLGVEKNGTQIKLSSVASAKKKLFFSPSSVGPRTHSGPFMGDTTSSVLNNKKS